MNAFDGASPSVLEVLPTAARAMIGKLFSPTKYVSIGALVF